MIASTVMILRPASSSSSLPEVAMLDFQLSRRARPSIDLGYFLGSTLTPQLRTERANELLHFYHDSLVAELGRLGYNGESLYTFEDLQEDMAECGPFRLLVSHLHTWVR